MRNRDWSVLCCEQVCFVLSDDDDDDTHVRVLDDPHRSILQRGEDVANLKLQPVFDKFLIADFLF